MLLRSEEAKCGNRYTPLILTLERQRQVKYLSSEASLVYRASSRIARGTQRNTVLKQNKTLKTSKQLEN